MAYRVSEHQTLKFSRRVVDPASSTVVFHFFLFIGDSNDFHQSCVELLNGDSLGIALDDELVIKQVPISTPFGYIDASNAFPGDGEPLEIEIEEYLISIGALPPPYEETEE